MVKIHNSTKKSTNSGCQTIKTQASGGVWKTVNDAAFDAVDRFKAGGHYYFFTFSKEEGKLASVIIQGTKKIIWSFQ